MFFYFASLFNPFFHLGKKPVFEITFSQKNKKAARSGENDNHVLAHTTLRLTSVAKAEQQCAMQGLPIPPASLDKFALLNLKFRRSLKTRAIGEACMAASYCDGTLLPNLGKQ